MIRFGLDLDIGICFGLRTGSRTVGARNRHAGSKMICAGSSIQVRNQTRDGIAADPTGKGSRSARVVKLVVDLSRQHDPIGNTHGEILTVAVIRARLLIDGLAIQGRGVAALPLPELNGPAVGVGGVGGQLADGKLLQGMITNIKFLTHGHNTHQVVSVGSGRISVTHVCGQNVRPRIQGDRGLGLGLGLGLGVFGNDNTDAGGVVIGSNESTVHVGDQTVNGIAADPAGKGLRTCVADLVVDLAADLRAVGNRNDEIVIPASVKVIGNDCFKESAVKTVYLPSGLENIGGYAFYNCAKLSKVYTDGVSNVQMGVYAFAKCESLEYIGASDDYQEEVINLNAFENLGAMSFANIDNGRVYTLICSFEDAVINGAFYGTEFTKA